MKFLKDLNEMTIEFTGGFAIVAVTLIFMGVFHLFKCGK